MKDAKLTGMRLLKLKDFPGCSRLQSSAEMLFKSRKGWIVGLLLCIIPAFVMLKGRTYKPFTDFYQHHIRLNETPCACHKCVSDHDPWFMERFDKSIDPFLTRKNSLSEDAYKWWKRLQYDKNSFSYGDTVEKLFNFFTNDVIFLDSSPARCRTCAVVGNSGNLNGSHYGALIDINDVIIRMNGARIKGYEEDVGRKTTIRVMYPESASDLDNNTHLLLFAFKVTDLQWLVSAFTTGTITRHIIHDDVMIWDFCPSGQARNVSFCFHFELIEFSTYQPVRAKIKANKDLVMVLSPAFIKYVHELWLNKHGSYPSTGFLALILSLYICDEVNVFGYGADKNGNWNHYWEKLRDKSFKTGIHGGINEYKVILQLSDKQKINFFKGW